MNGKKAHSELGAPHSLPPGPSIPLHIPHPGPEFVAKTTSGMLTDRLLRWSRHQASGPDEAERRSA